MADTPFSNKRIARNTLFLYFRMILVLGVTLYTSRVVLHTLGVVDYGVYNVVAGFVSMFAFMNVSLSNGTQRYYNYALGQKEENGIQKVFITALTIQVLIAFVLVLLLETVGLWYINNKMVIPPERMVAAHWVFQCSIASMVLMMMQIPYSAVIVAFEKMDYYAAVGIVDAMLKLGIVYILPLVSADRLQLYGLLLLGISFTDFFLYSLYAKRHVRELRVIRFFDKSLFLSMLGFSGWNICGTLAFMMKGQGLNMILNLFFGPIVNAARGIAGQVMGGLQGFSANILVAFRPQLIQSYAAKDYGRVRSIFFSESKISYLMLLLLTTPIILEIDFILDVWLGRDMVPEYTESFTILVLLNMLVSAFHQPLTHIVHATGKQKMFQLMNALIICSILPVSWLFLRLGYGPNSAFVVSLILTSINVLSSVLIVRSLFYFSLRRYFIEVIWPCLLVTMLIPIIPFICTRLIDASFVRLLIVLSIEVIIGLPMIYFLALKKGEKKMINGFINKKILRK